jgi:hypothetical protein
MRNACLSFRTGFCASLEGYARRPVHQFDLGVATNATKIIMISHLGAPELLSRSKKQLK